MNALASALYIGEVAHRRLRPHKHALRYRTFALLIDLDEAPTLARRLRWFSLSAFNLFSFYEADYGAPGGGPLRGQIEALLRQAGVEDPSGPIQLLTMPRILGYAFNPLSIFFCWRREGEISALIYEVRNTFGQKHSYVIPATASDDGLVRQSCAKALYVSPFMPMAMRYDFTVRPPDETLSVVIVERDASGVVLTATQAQSRVDLTDRALLNAFFTHPLLTMKVIAGIHFEALLLWRKGMRLVPRPAAPPSAVTLVAAQPQHAQGATECLEPQGEPERMI